MAKIFHAKAQRLGPVLFASWRPSLRLCVKLFVNAIHDALPIYVVLGRRIEALIDPVNPLDRRQSTPPILWTIQQLRLRPSKSLRHAGVNRPINIPQLRAAFSPIKPNLDVRLAPDMHLPATTKIDHCSFNRLNHRRRIVFNFSRPKQRTLHVSDARKPEGPQRQIDQMRSEVQHTPTACERVVVEPCLVRSVSVMKLRIDRSEEHTSELQ